MPGSCYFRLNMKSRQLDTTHQLRGCVQYTMDHEVVWRPCKIGDWLLNSSREHFNLHQGTNVRVTMEFWGPQTILSTNMVHWVPWWERQKRCSSTHRQGPMAKNVVPIKFLWIFLLGKRIWRQEKTREWSNLNVIKAGLLDIYLKKSPHSLFGAWSFLLVHIRFTPSEGAKGFVNWF